MGELIVILMDHRNAVVMLDDEMREFQIIGGNSLWEKAWHVTSEGGEQSQTLLGLIVISLR